MIKKFFLDKTVQFILLILTVAGAGFYVYSLFTVNESIVEDFEKKLIVGTNNDYYSVALFENEELEPYKEDDAKVYSYKLSLWAEDAFYELDDNGKIDEVLKLINIINDNTESGLFSCGRNIYCNISDIEISSTFTDEYKDEDRLKFTYSNDLDDKEILASSLGISNDSVPTNSTSTYSEPLILEETSCEKDNGYIYAKGYVKNNSNQTLSFIKVQANFNDVSGNVVDTNYTYAVGSEGLAPNSRKSYDIMAPDQSNITNCKYNIVDYQ